ncbi:MAG: alpha/beta fold hydrolase [Deltaproteobacteria bacterium]|nr:alpha/beta fold hydrolase [Deltaproteobacteria bacterium]
MSGTTRELNGTTLYYEDTGPGSTGETIVFSHGLLWSTELFAPQIAALRDRYRCIAWDHRGQGRSAADHREHIGMELVWQDAVQLLEHLAAGPVHFCGLSMGGFVAMRMAARRPDLVRSLLLLETSSEPEPLENVARYRLLTRVTRLLGTRVVRGQIAPIMMGRTIRNDPARTAELAGFVEVMSRRRDIWRAINGVIDRPAIHDELARITAPTLIIVGDEDTATPLAKAEKIRSGIAGAQLVRIPGAGHSCTVEQPVAVTAALAQFLGAR